MNTLRLIRCNLAYFRAPALAVVAGMAVATAALAGALMVGDSVRGSLRDLAVRRLGPTDYALVGGRFFGDDLARRLAAANGLGSRYEFVPGVIVNGGASVGEGNDKRRAGDVQVAALGGGWAPAEAGTCVLNGEAADALGLAVGPGRVVFTFPSMDEAPREAAVARRGVEEAAAALPADRVAAVAREPGMLSLFNLAGGQRTPRNAWVNLKELQTAVGQPGRANVLLVHAKAGGADGTAELNTALKGAVELADYGLEMKPAGKTDEAMLAASGTYLPPAAVAAAQAAATAEGIAARLVTVDLVNGVVKLPTAGATTQPGVESALHYVIGAGISSLDDGPLAPDEIALNEFTARQLGASIGDRIRLDFFRREAAGELKEVRSTDLGFAFRVAKILPMTGLGADPSLTPQYKGLTDAPSVSDWDPPRELGITGEKLRLAERDNDAYWKQFKASPRLFVHIDTARKLWGGPYGDVTGVRVPADKAAVFAARLKGQLDPAAMGLNFRAVKAEQLAAATGGTDFSELFVYFSFFLIVAAALLVAMLFRLTIEQRARQLGLMAAVGFGPGRLRGLALAEGLMLAVVGGVIGLGLAVGYTALIVHGLRTRWVGAVGTTALELHVRPQTLIVGFAASLAVAAAAVLWGVWRVAKLSPSRLLAGAFNIEKPGPRRSGRVTRMVGVALAAAGLGVLALVLARIIPQAEVALAGGGLLLCGGLTWLGGRLRPRRGEGGAAATLSSVTGLGVRNASRHTARSVLSVGLIAFAAFTLITVAAMQRNEPEDTGDPHSGAGGYRLIVQAGVPILSDLNTPAGRDQAGVREPNAPLWGQAKFLSMRRWAGQDISCLNLTRPTAPTILGVPPALTTPADPAKPADHRFAFSGAVKKVDNPWTLLETESDPNRPDEVPVVTDAETAEFILKLHLGGTMAITDPAGRPRQLRLVATLAHSIFQSEMLMSEANFRRLFPAQAGFGTILVDVPADQVQPVQRLLNNELDPYAVSVDTTAARLATYRAIINTYLDTFRVLGSLGLALGSIGLAVVLIRNVIERRPELALLAALGFRPGDRVRLVLSETAFLLVLGLGVGTACALLGVLPTVLTGHGGIAWGPLFLTLLGVLVLGFVASAAAVWVGGVRITPADLRRE